MPKYVWVFLGMIAAGLGGVAGVWTAFATLYQGDNQFLNPEVARNLLQYGGVFAAMCGGAISLKRGPLGERSATIRGVMALLLGLGVCAAIAPQGALIAFNPFSLFILVGIWPFALLGGMALLAILWLGLWSFGGRPRPSEATN